MSLKLLLDISETRAAELPDPVNVLLIGQLLTPLTMYTRWGDPYAIDNGAYTKFRAERFASLLERESECKGGCLFVSVPDVVGSAKRTREIWHYRHDMVPEGWPLAYVCQDGSEDIGVPWEECDAVFIGGSTEWKMSQHAARIIKTAKIIGKHAHVGRVNTRGRFQHFDALGADTCDGSGLARYDWMLERLVAAEDHPLFDQQPPLDGPSSNRRSAAESRRDGRHQDPMGDSHV
jgi:hypothetical protein